MQGPLQYAVLGIGMGALYALLAQGLVLIYRASGVLNFAHGAIGMVGAFVEWEARTNHGVPWALSYPLGVITSAAVGAACFVLVIRPLRAAAAIMRIVSTLGILVMLQSIAILRYGTKPRIVRSVFPQSVVELPFDVRVGSDRLIILAIAIVISLTFWGISRFTMVGVATEAVAEKQRAAAHLGWSPDAIGGGNWAVGAGLAGLAAILISTIVQLQVGTMTTLLLVAMAAALVAGFDSYLTALVAGLGIGVVQVELQRYVTTPGVWESVPFIVIVLVLVLRGRALPLRDFAASRLPALGTGRVRPVVLACPLAVIALIEIWGARRWIDALVITAASALILLSLVVLTGYAGQISLAQYTLAGVAAWVCGRLQAELGWSFVPAALCGVAATGALGAVFALPAVRTRGLSLAIVTLGMAAAIEALILRNPRMNGGFFGTVVSPPTLLGIDIDPIRRPERYLALTIACFTGCAFLVANLRRSRSGRRLIAVRANERAAAALGISVPGAKVYAFVLSASLAGVGGILLAFTQTSLQFTQFSSFNSVTMTAWSVLGGVGFLVGPLVGATFVNGSVVHLALNDLIGGVGQYLQLIGGALVVLTVLFHQDGLGSDLAKSVRKVVAHPPMADDLAVSEVRRDIQPVGPRLLEVRGLSVRYGGVRAVSDVSFSVATGEIVGLIGPNGAGKTTIIDAVTGFTHPSAGVILLDEREINRMSVTARARAGLSRSFQSLELFDDLSVMDNLRIAVDPRNRGSYVTDLVRPREAAIPATVEAAIREFRLERVLGHAVEELSYGQRRLVAIARAVAASPSTLLLDEPAAGLSDTESKELGRLLRRLADEWNIGILLVEHDVDLVMETCDRVVVVEFGHVISEGEPSAVANDPLVIAAYLGGGDREGASEPCLRPDGATAHLDAEARA